MVGEGGEQKGEGWRGRKERDRGRTQPRLQTERKRMKERNRGETGRGRQTKLGQVT